jgi:hypothetical protein
MKRWYLVSGLILLALLGSLAAAGPLFLRVDQPALGLLADGGETREPTDRVVPSGALADRIGEPPARVKCEMYCEEMPGLGTAEILGSTRPGPVRVSEWLMTPAGFP